MLRLKGAEKGIDAKPRIQNSALEFAPRHSARFPDSQVFVAQVPADECRFTKRANDKGQLWDTVIADVNMASHDTNRSFYSVIRTDIVEVQKG